MHNRKRVNPNYSPLLRPCFQTQTCLALWLVIVLIDNYRIQPHLELSNTHSASIIDLLIDQVRGAIWVGRGDEFVAPI